MSKPLVSDELWTLVARLLPPEQPKGGRPCVFDRVCLTGIIFGLKSGVPWELLPTDPGCGSGMTCWRRLLDWQEAGVGGACTIPCSMALGRPTPSTGAAPRSTRSA